MSENSIKENAGNWKKMPQYFLFAAALFIYLTSGIFLKINIAYSLAAAGLIVLSLFLRAGAISMLSLVPFCYALWKMKAIPLENIFLFILGYVASYIFILQFGSSGGKEINPFISYAAGFLLAVPLILFSAMEYEIFSSNLMLTPFGAMLAVLIIIFFRMQYFIWKNR